MPDLVIAKSINGTPSEFQVFPYGQVLIEGEGPAYLDEESMDLILSTFNRRGNDMVVDYEHQTLKGVRAPAAGWIKRLEARGKQGLWALADWTMKAKDYIANREYRYFSPVFSVRKRDRKIIEIKTVALTNAPRINSLTPIIAKRNLGVQMDEKVLQVAKLMGNTEEDIAVYGGDPFGNQEVVTLDEAIVQVAKLIGNTEEDIQTYGVVDTPYNENDEDKIKRLLGNAE